MQVDDILWGANMAAAERPWWRWLKGAAGTAGCAALPLLVTAGNGGVGGVPFRIVLCGTALAFAVCAVLLVRDLRSLVDVRVVGGENPQLRMTTTAGRIVTRAAEDVARVEQMYTPWLEQSIGSDGQLRLELELRRGALGYRGRWRGTTTEETQRTMDLWQRVCPAATVTKSHRLRTPGTGD